MKESPTRTDNDHYTDSSNQIKYIILGKLFGRIKIPIPIPNNLEDIIRYQIYLNNRSVIGK